MCREVGCDDFVVVFDDRFILVGLWVSAGWLERTVGSFVLKNLAVCVCPVLS